MMYLRKSTCFFLDEKYQEMPYGTIYYIASNQNTALNEYVKTNIDTIVKKLENESSVWISVRLVYLESTNDYFDNKGRAAFYAALIPYQDEQLFPKYGFFTANIDNFSPQYFWDAIHTYVQHLEEMFDEALEGNFDEAEHIKKSDYIFSSDEKVEFSIGGPRFSITASPSQTTFTEPSRLIITENTFQLLLPDYNSEIKFNAQIKALYVLFLRHIEGIRLQELDEHRHEFTQLYLLFTNRSDKEKLLESINKLLDITKPHALHVKKSQCYKALREAIPNKDLLQHYEIKVHRGEAHSISLDRSLVTYPERISQLN